MGAWIEIKVDSNIAFEDIVAPFVGAWIEINPIIPAILVVGPSHPSWVRGLK